MSVNRNGGPETPWLCDVSYFSVSQLTGQQSSGDHLCPRHAINWEVFTCSPPRVRGAGVRRQKSLSQGVKCECMETSPGSRKRAMKQFCFSMKWSDELCNLGIHFHTILLLISQAEIASPTPLHVCFHTNILNVWWLINRNSKRFRNCLEF